jgi:hypothetical protein
MTGMPVLVEQSRELYSAACEKHTENQGLDLFEKIRREAK